MGRKEASTEALAAKSLSKGYRPGVHKAKDSLRDKKTYVEKTIKDHEGALRQYEK